MTASARTAEGEYYHVYNRGNHKEAIFHQPRDYERFLWAAKDGAEEYGVEILAYCLMPNHFHLLVLIREAGSLRRMMQSFMTSYAMYFNRAYGYVGHLFQGRYRVRQIRNTKDLLDVSRYIHRNPVGLAPIGEYEWSTYRSYVADYPDRYANTALVRAIYSSMYGESYASFCEDVKRSDLPAASSYLYE